MKTILRRGLALIFVLTPLFLPAALRGQDANTAWNVAMLDQILASVPPGGTLAQIGDMEYPVATLQAWRDQLATGVTPLFTVGSGVNLWPGGNVYYTFSNGISAGKQKAFTDAAAEWTLCANVHFVPWTVQPNYVLVMEDPALQGGLAVVGMAGGQQWIHIGPNAWNRHTLTHEVGHTLGLVHEHQRSDRDSYLTVISNNIESGEEFNFVLLPTATNRSPYDFLSIMHYAHNAFSSSPDTLDTMVPLPAYTNLYSQMGHGDPVLSVYDRSNMAALYGIAPPLTNRVTNTQDNSAGSLRASLYYGFDHPGATITFNIATNDPGYTNGVFTIGLSDQLSSLFNNTVIDATTEPVQLNPNGPAIQISGSLAALLVPPANGVHFMGTNSAVRGLVINGFPSSAVALDSSNAVSNTVSGCFLGVDPTGQTAVTNGLYPVLIEGGARGNLIGGTNAAARNVISGGSYQGVFITGAGTSANVIEGNYIGLNAAGTAALPNNFENILIYDGPVSNIIGGTVAGARNVISGGNSQGITISGVGTTGNVIEGNYIGLNAAGTAAVPNAGAGVFITSGATGNTVGGPVPGAGNVVSGNVHQGIILNANNNVVAGNLVGLNASGSGALPNSVGVNFYGGAQGNLVGGNTPAARNVISGNNSAQVQLQDAGTDFNVIEGNYIGTSASGMSSVPTTAQGVVIFGTASSNVIGGTSGGARNIISGNAGLGLNIQGVGTVGNVVEGNTIGLDALNNNAIPNPYAIEVFGGATGTQIGGLSFGAANLIASNTTVGVFIAGSTTSNNTMRGNSIYGNSATGQFGILVQSSGNNNMTSPPGITSAVVGASNTTVIGSLSSYPASTTFHIDFYASPGTTGSAQARDYVGTKDVTTSGAGSATFTNQLALLPIGRIITATATDPAGNTSTESFSGTPVTGVSTVGDGIPDAWRAVHFGGSGTTTNSTNCATCDADNDGLNNLGEFLAGTNPTNAASALKAGTLAKSGADVVLTFQSVAGVVYRIYQRDDVLPGNWVIMADQVLGTGGPIQLTDPGAAALPRRYYKLQVLP